MSEYIIINGQLYHHGIKGQKWGVRRFQNKNGSLTPAGRQRYSEAGSGANKETVKAKKAAYKTDRKEYNKAFNKAYDKAIAAWSPVKKHRDANDERWADARSKAEKVSNSKKEYKQAKKDYKQAKKDVYNEINKQTGRREKLIFNNATRRKAAKYVVDNDMSMEDARKRANKDARRNTAIFVAACGLTTLEQLRRNK